MLLDQLRALMMTVKVVMMKNKRKKMQQKSRVQKEISTPVLTKVHLRNSLIQRMKLKRLLKHRRKALEPRALQPTKQSPRPRILSRFRRRF